MYWHSVVTVYGFRLVVNVCTSDGWIVRSPPYTVLMLSRLTPVHTVPAHRRYVLTSPYWTSTTTLRSSSRTSTRPTSLSTCLSAVLSALCRRLTATLVSIHSLLTRSLTPMTLTSRSVATFDSVTQSQYYKFTT